MKFYVLQGCFICSRKVIFFNPCAQKILSCAGKIRYYDACMCSNSVKEVSVCTDTDGLRIRETNPNSFVLFLPLLLKTLSVS